MDTVYIEWKNWLRIRLISAQILNRLSLLARESHSILERQIETCALQPTDFKVGSNSEAVSVSAYI